MSSAIPEDLSHLDLPPDVLERLSELDLELAEGKLSIFSSEITEEEDNVGHLDMVIRSI